MKLTTLSTQVKKEQFEKQFPKLKFKVPITLKNVFPSVKSFMQLGKMPHNFLHLVKTRIEFFMNF